MEASSPRWRELSAGRPRRPSSSGRRPVVLGLSAVLLALLGGLIAWLYFAQPYVRPHFLPVVLDEYGAGIPPRPWARQDAEALRGLDWDKRSEAFTRQTRARLVEELKGLAQGRPETPVIVYLSGYVVFDGASPALLPVDGRPDDRTTWLPLADVFAHVSQARAKHKLVLFDVMQPLLVPPRGLVDSDVAGRVWPTLRKAVDQDDRLSIFCACSPGQLSWAAEELGHSVFGHYLRRALAGDADGWGSGKRDDNHITSGEVIAYVTRHVDAWAKHNVGVRQTPAVLGNQAEFRLLPRATAGEAAAALPDKYPGWLRDAWKLRDAWWDAGVHRRSPRLVRDVGEATLSAERRWRSGVAEDRVRADLETRLGSLRRKKAEAADPDDGKPASLAQAVARKPGVDKPPAEDSLARLRDLLARRDALKDPKREEVEKLAADVKAFAKAFKDSPDALVAVACTALAEHTVGPGGVGLLAELLDDRREVEGYDEVRFIARLARRAKDRPGDWSAAAAQQAMQAVREATQANTARPEAMAWVSGPREEAVRLYDAGNVLLFETDRPWGEPARAAWEAARKAAERVNADLAVVEAALRGRDETLVLLPGYVGALEVDDGQAAVWRGAIAVARELRAALRVPLGQVGPDRASRLARLSELTRSLQEGPHSLQILRQPLAKPAFAALIKQRPSGILADASLRRALLATTWPSAEQRADLWASYRGHARRLHETTPSPPPALSSWEEPDWGRARAALRRRDVDRARRAHRVWQLYTLEDLAELATLLDGVAGQPAEQAGWDKLAEGLRRAADRAGAAEGP